MTAWTRLCRRQAPNPKPRPVAVEVNRDRAKPVLVLTLVEVPDGAAQTDVDHEVATAMTTASAELEPAPGEERLTWVRQHTATGEHAIHTVEALTDGPDREHILRRLRAHPSSVVVLTFALADAACPRHRLPA